VCGHETEGLGMQEVTEIEDRQRQIQLDGTQKVKKNTDYKI
jgi:hypothetical protein